MLDPGLHYIGCSLWAQLMFNKFQTMRALWGELWGTAFNPCPPVGQAHDTVSISLMRCTTHTCGLKRLFKCTYLWQNSWWDGHGVIRWSSRTSRGQLYAWHCAVCTSSYDTEYNLSAFIESSFIWNIISNTSQPNVLSLIFPSPSKPTTS